MLDYIRLFVHRNGVLKSRCQCKNNVNMYRMHRIGHIIQIHKVQILLFCYIDNYIFLCYSLLVSRFFLFQISKSAQVDVCDFREIPAYLPHLIQ